MLDFLGIGAQKAGTTWLFDQLRKHPDICFPVGKETHFWSKHYVPGDYFQEFQPPYFQKFNATPAGAVCGEITPGYAILSTATIDEIYQYNPKLRIVLIIRNPIDRAWSAALMAMNKSQITFQEASNEWFSIILKSAASISRGDYQKTIRTWRMTFPAENVLVLRYEDISTNPINFLNTCFTHLGVQELSAETLEKNGCYERIFSSSTHELPSELRPLLEQIYQIRIRQLSDYLHEDLTTWLS
jgi:hypothetical protein